VEGHDFEGTVQTLFEHKPYKQSLFWVQAPTPTEVELVEKHFVFASPTIPRYPDKQPPQVFGVKTHGDRNKELQYAADTAEQFTIFIVDAALFIVWKAT
jgi:hypothetical protein